MQQFKQTAEHNTFLHIYSIPAKIYLKVPTRPHGCFQFKLVGAMISRCHQTLHWYKWGVCWSLQVQHEGAVSPAQCAHTHTVPRRCVIRPHGWKQLSVHMGHAGALSEYICQCKMTLGCCPLHFILLESSLKELVSPAIAHQQMPAFIWPLCSHTCS